MVSVFLVISSSLGGILAIVLTYQTQKIYNLIGTRFFRYANGFALCIFLRIVPILLMGLLEDQAFYGLLLQSQYMLRPFGYLAIALLIGAMESVRTDKRSMLTNIGFLFAGGLVAGLFSPPAFTFEWTGIFWTISYSIEFETGRMVLFASAIISALPLAYRLFNWLSEFFRKKRIFGVLFWVIVFLAASILVIQPLGILGEGAQKLVINPATFNLIISLFLLLVIILFHYHPTILFVETHEITELYIIKKESGLPLYHYKFKTDGNDGSEIISAFFTGIKQYVKHSIGRGEMERVLVGNQEMIIQQGMYTYGILIAKESSELTTSLLRLSVKIFENLYQFHNSDYVEKEDRSMFDRSIERYFEFAMIGDPN